MGCKLLGRRAAGVDTVMVARNRLDFSYAPLDADYVAPDIKTYVGDERSLDLIGSESVDLIATHPPYASIIPYSHDRVEGDLMSFLETGFILREDIIKLQWKMKSTREKWFGKKYDFFLIGHEHLYVFRKADEGEKVTKFRESMKWW